MKPDDAGEIHIKQIAIGNISRHHPASDEVVEAGIAIQPHAKERRKLNDEQQSQQGPGNGKRSGAFLDDPGSPKCMLAREATRELPTCNRHRVGTAFRRRPHPPKRRTIRSQTNRSLRWASSIESLVSRYHGIAPFDGLLVEASPVHNRSMLGGKLAFSHSGHLAPRLGRRRNPRARKANRSAWPDSIALPYQSLIAPTEIANQKSLLAPGEPHSECCPDGS